MGKVTGWILDTYIQDNEAVTWLRTNRGQVLRLTDRYAPRFYILPRDKDSAQELFEFLQNMPHIEKVIFEEKAMLLGGTARPRFLQVTVDRTRNYRRLLDKIEAHSHVKTLYNTDLLHVQQYLFTRLGVAPTSKVVIEDNDKEWTASIQPIDDSTEIAPPPFRSLTFDIRTEAVLVPPNSQRDPITSLEVTYENEEHVLQGREETLLDEFAALVKSYDPDLLICPEFASTITYLFDRTQRLQLNLQLGRAPVDLTKLVQPVPHWFPGRVGIDYRYIRTFGIAGMVERARFSVLPPGLAAKWTANRVIDSRNCFELLKRGYVIPANTGHYEYIRSIEDVVDRDRGGVILAPQIGVAHGNVGELDFESQFPHLIVSEGLSYETVTPEGVNQTEAPILPSVTKQSLERRLWFKRRRRRYRQHTAEWTWCEQRQLALKMILVCLYGTSGCCWNRFGNVLCFEEINSWSRTIIVKTKNLAQQEGFKVIYADTDSIFVKKATATREDYEALSRRIHQHLGLPVALDHHYKLLLLLPLEADPSGNMEAQKRYFGVLTDGQILARGIEIRRHDCPAFIKNFQTQLIRTLFRVETADDVHEEGYRNAVKYVHATLEKLAHDEIPLEGLTISKILRKPVSEYTRLFPHVSAARNLVQQGRTVTKGDLIDFVYVNARHHNPLRRVAPLDSYGSQHYDKEKYRDMILDAAETILATFGFSRQQFGLRPKAATWHHDWREEVRLETETEDRIHQ